MLIEAQGIKKTFYDPHPIEVLRGVSLTLEAGKSLAITGPSGSGKSTLLHILGTLEPATEGSLLLCNYPVNAQSVSRCRNQLIGFVFQAYHLFDSMSVLENVLLPAQIARNNVKNGSSAHHNAVELLEKVGLKDRMDFAAALLSGGEKQRVCIARALINGNPIILADEPTGNLDSENSEIIQNLLLDLCKQSNKGLIVATHDKAFASRCDAHLNLEK